jgi:DNA repair exonuclease SbcCD ATPase subunit
MFQLNKIELTNFRSYKGTHSFEFPLQSGLYFFAGENKLDDLGANGAGKSTFLDAIVWCLYGRTARGLKAADVLSWDTVGGCSVSLHLTVGEKLEVKRSQKPNGLWVNGDPVDQEGLEKFIRLNCESFLHSVMNAQFGTSFFSLTPSAKLELFSDILKLDTWLDWSQLAAKRSEEVASRIKDLQSFIAREGGRLEGIKADIEVLKSKEQTFEYEIRVELKKLSSELVKLRVELKSLTTDETRIRSKKLATKADHDAISKKFARLEADRDKHIAGLQECNKQKAVFQDRLNRVGVEIATVRSWGALCTCCKQKIDDKHRAAMVKKLLTEKEDMLDELALEDEECQMRLKLMVKAKLAVGLCETEFEKAAEELAALNAKLFEMNNDIVDIERRIARLEHDIEKTNLRSNPYSKLLEPKRAELAALTGSIKRHDEAIDELEIQHAATSYWVKGFKQIRLHIIEQAFQSLEMEVNNSLAQLGMADWHISFDIERENKSGGITKGFIVFIKSPHNKLPVRWESWSGGETQRLQLAGDLGLANLIMHQQGLTNTIEIFDEPSTHLSKEGLADLANLLYDRATTDNKQIWIVDHTAMSSFGEFNGIITAKKDANGSTISANF